MNNVFSLKGFFAQLRVYEHLCNLYTSSDKEPYMYTYRINVITDVKLKLVKVVDLFIVLSIYSE